jgi:dsDNA-binding SOS-regulon protein
VTLNTIVRQALNLGVEEDLNKSASAELLALMQRAQAKSAQPAQPAKKAENEPVTSTRQLQQQLLDQQRAEAEARQKAQESKKAQAKAKKDQERQAAAIEAQKKAAEQQKAEEIRFANKREQDRQLAEKRKKEAEEYEKLRQLMIDLDDTRTDASRQLEAKSQELLTNYQASAQKLTERLLKRDQAAFIRSLPVIQTSKGRMWNPYACSRSDQDNDQSEVVLAAEALSVDPSSDTQWAPGVPYSYLPSRASLPHHEGPPPPYEGPHQFFYGVQNPKLVIYPQQ